MILFVMKIQIMFLFYNKYKQKMCRKSERNKYRSRINFVIENGIFRIFMTFNVIAIIASALFTVVNLLYYSQKNRIE